MLNDIVPIDQDLWMRDSDTRTCMCCGSPFTTFRRRHHCRYCGLVFCSKCTSDKKELSQGQVLKKICNKCLNSLIYKQKTQTPVLPSTNDSQPGLNSFHKDNIQDSLSSLQEDMLKSKVFTPSNDVPHEVAQILLEINEKSNFSSYSEDYFRTLTLDLLTFSNIELDLAEVLMKLVKSTVETISPSVQFRGDFMNINKYVKIQKVLSNNLSVSDFFPGIAFPKNLAHKKMCKLIENPKILLIKEISEGNNSDKTLVSMDKLIDQELSLTSITLKRILSLGPKVIICSKGLPQQFLNELAKSKITALINVDKLDMDLVARATQGKVLNNTDEVHHERNFLGQCREFVQEEVGQSWLVKFRGLNDPSLLGTILIPNLEKRKLLKKVMKTLLVEYRNLKIEMGFFKLFGLGSSQNPFFELKSQKIDFKHIVISKNKMCMKPESLTVEFYDSKDMTLGEFITTAAERADQKCNECGESWGAHVFYYIKRKLRIKIAFSKWISENKSSDITVTNDCRVCGKISPNVVELPRSIWEYSFFKFLNNFFIESSLQKFESRCRHPFFSHYSFTFHVKTLKIMISSEPYPCFEFIPCVNKPKEFYFQGLLSYSLTELKQNIEVLIEKISISYRETSNKILKEIAEDKQTSDEDIKEFNLKVDKILTRLTELQKKILTYSESKFENYLKVESTRKKYFFKILRIRQEIISTFPISRRGRRRDKTLPDSISSSGDSSGDRRPSASPTPSFVAEEDVVKIRRESSVRGLERTGKEEILNQPEYLFLQKGNLTLPDGMDGLVVPVDENDLMSIIAYALNTPEYNEAVLKNFPKSSDLDKVESELLQVNESHFQINFTTCDEDYFKELAGKDNLNLVYGNYITFNVHAFYPRQFQIIRDKILGSHLDFIMSMFSFQSKKEQLGKSKASFFKSNNELFLLKVVDEKEFQMFKELAPNYFKHFCNSNFHNMPCLMVKTLGCFRVYIKNHTKNKSKTKWVLLSENLCHSLPKDLEVYDLKGSFNHRRQVAAGEKRTKMDRNFLEDFGGLPIIVSKDVKKMIEISAFNDSLFLSKNNIVDYSLLLGVSRASQVLALGIIDYIAKYTFEKAIEHKYKKVVGTDNPTITKPVMYKSRFRDSVAHYFFMGLEE